MIRSVRFTLLLPALDDEKQTGEKSSKDETVNYFSSKGPHSAAENQTRDAPACESQAKGHDEPKYRMCTQISTHVLAISSPPIHIHSNNEVI